MIADLITTEYVSDLLIYLDAEKLREDLIKAYGTKENINSRTLAIASKAHVQKTFFYTEWGQMLNSKDESLKNTSKENASKALERLVKTVNILKAEDPGTNENYTFALSASLESITHIQQFLSQN